MIRLMTGGLGGIILSTHGISGVPNPYSGTKAVTYRTSELPPGRVGFDATAPSDISLGRLWSDVAWFYPFSPSQSRPDWERRFFELLNQASEQPGSLGELAADAVGALADPASMSLPIGEGEGEHMLPLVFTSRPDGVWIIGGSKAQVSEPFGPLASVDGMPLSRLLRSRVGVRPTSAQTIAALQSWARRPESFKAILAVGERKLEVASVAETPKDLWIDGGWKGFPLHEVPVFENNKPLELDLRAAHLVRGGQLSQALRLLVAWRRAAKTFPVYRVSWTHLGMGSEFGTYQSRLTSESLAPAQDSSGVISVSSTLGDSAIIPIDVAEMLVGWAVPATASLPAKIARYKMGSFWIQLRVATFGDPHPHQIGGTPSRRWLAPGWGASKSLSPRAAKALAAATAINFDHHWAFTPEEFQIQAFRSTIAAADISTSVYEVLQRAGAATMDAHPNSIGRARGAVADRYAGVRDESISPKPKFGHPFYLLPDPSHSKLLVLAGSKECPAEIAVGSWILNIDGRPVSEWLRKAAEENPVRPGELQRLGFVLRYKLQAASHTLDLIRPDGVKKQVIFHPIPISPNFSGDPAPAMQPLPAGWQLVSGGSISYPKLDELLEGGTNVILDTRFGVPSGNLQEIHGGPINADAFTRTPSQPISWGVEQRSTPYQVNPAIYGMGKNQARGRLVIVVWGGNQSRDETHPWSLRLAYPGAKLVGLPTAGITTPIAELFLPAGGGSDSHVGYYPTGAWSAFNGKSFHFRGLALDWEVPQREIQQWAKRGSYDPLLDAIIYRFILKKP